MKNVKNENEGGDVEKTVGVYILGGKRGCGEGRS